MPPAETPSPDAPEPDEGSPPADAPLLRLRDGLGKIVETEAGLAEVCEAMARGTGPVAIDAERASGYRYSARAYLIQLRREGSGTFLVDPIAFDSMAPLQEVLEGTEWILHAATQDLPCLNEVGLYPTKLFDTELAGRLLGHPRVGLATLVETLLGYRMAKEHSAVDWSTRPLPGAVAGVRRPRRRGPRRAARGARRRAGRGRQGRLGRRGVRVAEDASPRPSASTSGGVRRACTRCAAAGPWVPCAPCGRRATRSRPSAT